MIEQCAVHDPGSIWCLVRVKLLHPFYKNICSKRNNIVQCITKTYLYNFDPLQSHFYLVKLGFTGVNIIFLISAQNIDCGYSLEPPVLSRNMKNIKIFYLKIFIFLTIKLSVYLNRRVFIMVDPISLCEVTQTSWRSRSAVYDTASECSIYSGTSMARTPLGPWKIVQAMGSSSQ